MFNWLVKFHPAWYDGSKFQLTINIINEMMVHCWCGLFILTPAPVPMFSWG
jgi:hypothetical protein